MSAFERFTAKTAPVPREYGVTFYVACFNGSPDLARPFCSKSCAINTYADGPEGFLIQRRTLPGYVRVECPGCGLSIQEAQA